MIKHLSGDYETVEYDSQRSIMLYDNVQTEAYPIHWHNAVEIIMPLKNPYKINVGDTDYDLREYDIIIVPAAELHSMPPMPGRRIIFQCDNAVLRDVAALEPVMRGLSQPVIITPELDKELHLYSKKAMLDIFDLYNTSSELADVKVYSTLILMLIALREFQLKSIALECDGGKLDEYSEKFGVVLKYIDANYMYDISLDQLADVAGYSKYHFSRIFKQYNQMSYLQYINARRTKAAEQLLLDPSIPITEVAMRSGFKSLTTFNRIFKEIKHCTPSYFKKLYRDE